MRLTATGLSAAVGPRRSAQPATMAKTKHGTASATPRRKPLDGGLLADNLARTLTSPRSSSRWLGASGARRKSSTSRARARDVGGSLPLMLVSARLGRELGE